MVLAVVERPRARMAAWIRNLAATTTLLLWVPVASAQLDLAKAAVERLDNGMTVAVLEEPALPLVSVSYNFV